MNENKEKAKELFAKAFTPRPGASARLGTARPAPRRAVDTAPPALGKPAPKKSLSARYCSSRCTKAILLMSE